MPAPASTVPEVDALLAAAVHTLAEPTGPGQIRMAEAVDRSSGLGNETNTIARSCSAAARCRLSRRGARRESDPDPATACVCAARVSG